MELRHDLRLCVQCPIHYSGTRLKGEGTVLNLSTGGWQVTAPQPLPQGTPLLLRVALPDGQEPMEIEVATVRWSSGERFGLKNMIMRENEWKRLRRFVVENLVNSDFSTPRED